MNLFFNLSLAWRSIRTNALRSVLTVSIIALGIMALVGILTGIDVMKSAIYTSFSGMGANAFQISGDILKTKKGKGGRGLNISITSGKNVSWDEAKAFKDRFFFPASIGISMEGDGTAVVAYEDVKTNPSTGVFGIDEAYFRISNTKMDAGRDFSAYELAAGSNVCILGHGTANKLFKGRYLSGIDKIVSAAGRKLRVVGITEEKGGSLFLNADNTIYIPLALARAVYGNGSSFVISTAVTNVAQKPIAADESEGLMRGIRKVPLGTASDFSVIQDDSLSSVLFDSIRYIRWAAVLIGLITLIGSVIGLMNIMLVSVAERTREIGISKALGAKPATIRGQFLTESVLISLLGGAFGVLLGVLLGNVTAYFMHVAFIVPWVWLAGGITLCAIVGIISGIYPALKAARLDPIVALRYE